MEEVGRVSDDFHFIQFYIIKTLQYEPATLLLGVFSRQMKANVRTKKSTHVQAALFIIPQKEVTWRNTNIM